VASKPTVTLTLAGDEKKLTESFERTETAGKAMVDTVEKGSSRLADSFDQVGKASKTMGDKVAASQEGFDEVGRSSEDMVEHADNAESKAIGFTDTLSGMQGVMQGLNDDSLSFSDRLAMLGQGAADLAGGFANLVIPMISSMGEKLAATAAGQWALNAAQTAWTGITTASAVAMRLLNAAFIASPIGWIVLAIGGLVTAFVLLWNKSAAFRDFFIGIWDAIKSAVGSVVGWIVDRWNDIVSFFQGIPKRISDAFGALPGLIKSVFKAVVNTVVDAINWFLNHTINWLIDRVNSVSGLIGIPAIPRIPNIPRMHSGGVVPGLPGQERLMVLQGGEEVTTSGQRGSGGTIAFSGDTDTAVAKMIMGLVRIGAIRLETS
jgi:phage-related protein